MTSQSKIAEKSVPENILGIQYKTIGSCVCIIYKCEVPTQSTSCQYTSQGTTVFNDSSFPGWTRSSTCRALLLAKNRPISPTGRRQLDPAVYWPGRARHRASFGVNPGGRDTQALPDEWELVRGQLVMCVSAKREKNGRGLASRRPSSGPEQRSTCW